MQIIHIIAKLIPKKSFMSRKNFSVVTTLKYLVSEKCREISDEFQRNSGTAINQFRDNNDTWTL